MHERRLKAALFDLDGVVFDTEAQYTVFWGEQCRLYHPEHPGLEQEIKGSTLTQIYDQWFSGPLLNEQPVITERLNAYERQMSYDYIEGFIAFVDDLHKHGVKTAVVTSSNRPKMESESQEEYDAYLLDNGIEYPVTPDSVTKTYIHNLVDSFKDQDLTNEVIDKIVVGVPEIWFDKLAASRVKLEQIVREGTKIEQVQIVSEPALAAAYFIFGSFFGISL